MASLLISIRASVYLEVSGTDTQLGELRKRRCYYLYSLVLWWLGTSVPNKDGLEFYASSTFPCYPDEGLHFVCMTWCLVTCISNITYTLFFKGIIKISHVLCFLPKRTTLPQILLFMTAIFYFVCATRNTNIDSVIEPNLYA